MSDIKPRSPELEFVEPGSPEVFRAHIAGTVRAVRQFDEAVVEQFAPALQQMAEALSVPPVQPRQMEPQRELHRCILQVNAGNAR